MTESGVHNVTPYLTVIVPAYRCAGMLQRALDGMMASDLPRSEWELIVVDDGSPDETPAVARRFADLVLTTPEGPRGPGWARNMGADVARGEVLMFVDADVVVAPDALSRFAAAFRESRGVSAVFGSYDQTPEHPGLISQYRNLLHHRVHHEQTGAAHTFWAGCGAIRRDSFLAVGGYDALRYPRPQIEDIELGYRLSDAGYRIVLDPRIQGKHLKVWTLRSMMRADLHDRAIPWMRLLLERGDTMRETTLNLQRKEKVLTALMGVAMFSCVAALLGAGLVWLAVMFASLLIIVLGNLPLFRWFARVRGMSFTLSVVPLRLLFYVESCLGAAWAIITSRLQSSHVPKDATRSSSGRAIA